MYLGRKLVRRVGRGRLIAAPGKPAVLNVRHRPKVWAYADYSYTNALTQGVFAHRTYVLIERIHGEDGINCGVQSASNFPTSAPTYAGYVHGTKRTYRYKWVAGNNKPTIRGAYFGSNDTLSQTASAWLADPLNHFQANEDVVSLAANVNSTRYASALAVNVNPQMNCAEEHLIPEFETGP